MHVRHDGAATGAENMAVDAAMLDARAAAFRTYSWDPHCITLGRFEPDAHVDRAVAERLGIDVVRRPTGGGAILHGLDVTFCLVRPAPAGMSVAAIYRENAAAVAAGLARLGIEASCTGDTGRPEVAACFAGARGPDLRAGSRKICGAALRMAHGWCLMHGSVFLAPDWDRTAAVLPGTDAGALGAAAVTVGELRPGASRAEVEEALADGVRCSFDAAGRFRVEPNGDAELSTCALD